MQNRIDDVYEDLRTIELQIIEGRAYLDSRALWAEMQRIETEVARLRVPLTYSRELYVLRSHVQMVREELPGPPPAS